MWFSIQFSHILCPLISLHSDGVWIQIMMTSSNGNIFRVTGSLCGEFTGPGEFPTQRPVTRSFDVYFDLRLNKPLSKQPWGWWFETLSRSLWRHRNVNHAHGSNPRFMVKSYIPEEMLLKYSPLNYTVNTLYRLIRPSTKSSIFYAIFETIYHSRINWIYGFISFRKTQDIQ